jgi:predicted transcriptional regulator
MTILEILELVDGKIVTEMGSHQVGEVDFTFASDLMSDVLTVRCQGNLMLITGLANLQTIRTCEMSEIKIILIVRGKEVTEEMIELANDNDILLMRTKYSLYRTSGVLYNAGLKAVY